MITFATSFRTQFRVVDGLKAFAGRARRELLATAETARKRAVEAAGLATQEAQTGRLAWGGGARPDISTRLFTGLCTAGWRPGKVQSSKPLGLRSFGHAYPGRPAQVRRVRADLRVILGGCPVADETILVASELAANAVTHSSSRRRAAGSSSAPRCAPASVSGSKSRTRATPGPAITPEMAGATGSTSSRPSPETATGASTAMPPPAMGVRRLDWPGR